MGKNKNNNNNNAGCGTWLAMFLIIGLIGSIFPDNDKNDNDNDKSSPTSTQYVSESTELPINTPEPTQAKELSEKEYKTQCKEMYYDDVFFGKEDLEGELIKVNLFLSEKYYFTVDDTNKDTYKKHYENFKMTRNFYKCSVLRKDTDSYMGKGKIQMWFSNYYKLDPDDYSTGQKIVAYGEVVSWRNNTWDGYNQVIFVVKYIDTK